MDTSILHTRIQEYKDKAKNPVSKEMIFLFESWLLSIENHVSDVDLENYILTNKVNELEGTISLLMDLLIVTGNSDKLTSLNIKDEHTQKAINLLLKSKDRKNYNSISAISALLYINNDKEFESIEDLKAYVTTGS